MKFSPFYRRLVVLLSLFNVAPLMAASFTSLADLEMDKRPASSLHSQQLKAAPVLKAKAIDLAAIQKEDAVRDATKQPYRFALPVEANDFNHLGQWQVKGETAIWRLSVTAETAKSFSMGIKNLFMPQGAKLYFYSKDYQILLGPYTHKDNKANGQLWTPVIESNHVTIEFNVPLAYKNLLSFDIASISQGYRGIRAEDMVKSGTCNNDVVCPEGDPWRSEIRSVGHYTITDNGSSFVCTGTLVNNTRGDLTPYFLTAGHCGVSATTAASIVVYWNFETSVCGGTPDGPRNQFQSGTTFLATSGSSGVTDSDFALVQLDIPPSSNFNTHWAGWDRSDVAPSMGVSIHHPAGDEKRISFENDPLVITDYGLSTNTTSTHIMVTNWEDGTTEGGSSGSGIWNSDHRLVGTLSGGTASCTSPLSPDWYGRFSKHWDGNGAADGQVKTWLDPDATAPLAIDGRDACTAPTVTISSVPATANMGQSLNFSASATGGTGPYTYSWDVNQDAVEDLTGVSVNYSYNYLYRGNVKVTATDSTGCSGQDSAAIVVSNAAAEIFPLANSLPGDWMPVTGADAGWNFDNSMADEGVASASSATILDEQTAAVEVTQEFTGSGNFIAFSFKVSSEESYDRFVFEIDGVVKESWSGETGWRTAYHPLTAGSHTFKWSYIKDQSVSSGSDKAWVDGVTGITLPPPNDPPVAVVAQNLFDVTEGASVTMDASASSDPDGDTLSFSWAQTAGPTASLPATDTAILTFTAPDVSVNSVLTFEVVVSDPVGATSSQTVTVNVADVNNNQAPVAAIVNTSQTVDELTNVSLDASTSSDPDGDTLSYQWIQTGGITVNLTNANTATATFSAPQVAATATLNFSVTVTDPSGATSSADATVTVNNVPPPPRPPASSGGGGPVDLYLLGLMLLGFRLRKKSH